MFNKKGQSSTYHPFILLSIIISFSLVYVTWFDFGNDLIGNNNSLTIDSKIYIANAQGFEMKGLNQTNQFQNNLFIVGEDNNTAGNLNQFQTDYLQAKEQAGVIRSTINTVGLFPVTILDTFGLDTQEWSTVLRYVTSMIFYILLFATYVFVMRLFN